MKRKRDIQIKFYVSEREKALIDKKLEQLHTGNMGAYLTKVAIDGYILNLDMQPIKELAQMVRAYGNNINQIAKKANQSGIGERDIQEVKQNQAEIWNAFHEIIQTLGKA